MLINWKRAPQTWGCKEGWWKFSTTHLRFSHFKLVPFVVYKLYLNKTNKKNVNLALRGGVLDYAKPGLRGPGFSIQRWQVSVTQNTCVVFMESLAAMPRLSSWEGVCRQRETFRSFSRRNSHSHLKPRNLATAEDGYSRKCWVSGTAFLSPT